jgi:hypothetical protein
VGEIENLDAEGKKKNRCLYRESILVVPDLLIELSAAQSYVPLCRRLLGARSTLCALTSDCVEPLFVLVALTANEFKICHGWETLTCKPACM